MKVSALYPRYSLPLLRLLLLFLSIRLLKRRRGGTLNDQRQIRQENFFQKPLIRNGLIWTRIVFFYSLSFQ